MTKLVVSARDRVIEIKFTTDNPDTAARIRDICKAEEEKDIPVPKPILCPFCGYDKAVCYDVSLEREGVYLGLIGCTDCNVAIKHRFDISYGKKNAEITMVKLWNTRAKK